MSGNEAAGQDVVKRMLHAGERLRGVVVLVVYVQQVVLHSLAGIVREEVVVNEGFRALRRKLHHHASRRVGIHVGILARDVVVLHVHDVEEDVARLGLAGDGALVAVGDVLLRHVLAARLHQLQLHSVLNLLHIHLRLASLRHVVGNLVHQALVLTLVGLHHSLAYGGHDFLFIEADDATVALHNCLYHNSFIVLGCYCTENVLQR